MENTSCDNSVRGYRSGEGTRGQRLPGKGPGSLGVPLTEPGPVPSTLILPVQQPHPAPAKAPQPSCCSPQQEEKGWVTSKQLSKASSQGIGL